MAVEIRPVYSCRSSREWHDGGVIAERFVQVWRRARSLADDGQLLEQRSARGEMNL